MKMSDLNEDCIKIIKPEPFKYLGKEIILFEHLNSFNSEILKCRISLSDEENLIINEPVKNVIKDFVFKLNDKLYKCIEYNSYNDYKLVEV